MLDSATNGTIPYSTGVLAVALVTAFYSVIGGMRAIIWTDVLQGVLFVGIILLGVWVAPQMREDLSRDLRAASAHIPDLFVISGEGTGGAVTLAFIWTLGFIVLPHIWQRSYIANDARSFSRGIVLFSVLSLVLVMATMLTGILGAPLVEAISDSDRFVPALYQKYLPWALPLVVLGTFAAGMSTIDSQLLTASSVVVRDLCRPLFKSELTPSKEERLGRFVVFSLIAFLAWLALKPESQGSIILLASKGTAIAVLLFLPLWACLQGLQISGVRALFSILAGGASLLFLELGVVENPLPFGFGPIFIAVAVQAPVLFLIPKK